MDIDLGRATPIYRKQYIDTVAYELNDVVMYTDGNLYWHTAPDVTTGIAPTDDSVWSIAFYGADLLQVIQDLASSAALSKTAAETAAGSAGESAAAAAASANGADNSKTAAEDAKSAAQTAADLAVQSKTAAAGSASAAEGAKQAAMGAASKAAEAAIRQPYPDAETETWWVWDADRGAYTDTGISSKGLTGDKGDPFTYEDFTLEQLEALRGPAGKDGSDAAVTSENIANALGYTPADNETVLQLQEALIGVSDLIGGEA